MTWTQREHNLSQSYAKQSLMMRNEAEEIYSMMFWMKPDVDVDEKTETIMRQVRLWQWQRFHYAEVEVT